MNALARQHTAHLERLSRMGGYGRNHTGTDRAGFNGNELTPYEEIKRLRGEIERRDRTIADMRAKLGFQEKLLSEVPARSLTGSRLDQITQIVSDHCSVPASAIRGLERCHWVVPARHLCFYLAWCENFSSPRIGAFYDRDHSSVLHGVSAIKKKIAASPDYFAKEVEGLRQRVAALSVVKALEDNEEIGTCGP